MIDLHDLFRLMGYVFDEWLACAREGASHSVGHYANALVSLQ